jgi:hypothetical protein
MVTDQSSSVAQSSAEILGIANADGKVNGPDHPASPGSTVAVSVSGLGQTDPPSADGLAEDNSARRSASARVGLLVRRQSHRRTPAPLPTDCGHFSSQRDTSGVGAFRRERGQGGTADQLSNHPRFCRSVDECPNR